MENNEEKKYIYLGNDLDLPEFRFSKSGVYFGEKIEELKKKYPLLEKLLIDIEKLPEIKNNNIIFDKLTEELRKEMKGEDN